LGCGDQFEFDRPVIGDGWGGAETNQVGESFQWTAAMISTMELDVACDGEADVELRISSARGDDILAGLTLRVNGQPVDLILRPDTHRGWIFRGPLPLGAVGPTRLEFSVPRTAPPAGDARALGLAFDWLRVVPKAH
jgi:hypothetical protein